ncbi:hypothetical protein [Micromonospora halophytica]|uniref:Uncharacterized protein n=1 Tax=Micromonospora halophytica TaxID=47864 RepID=A0A1C5HRG3_9ACTN|nr:hypothetical protein [Micromonospora halophytica]SCG48580.1 hypothetical protein GA0070560_105279 [Micromonospora halophytica]
MRKLRALLGATVAGACAVTLLPGVAAAAPPPSSTAVDVTGTYYPVTPTRLVDTRTGLGVPAAAKIGPGQTVEFQVAGRGGLPSAGVGAVVLNVTVTGPTAASFVTAYPTGQARPNASSVNFPAGWLGSNNVTVKLGTGGKVSVYNRNGHTDLVVDVTGFYAADNTLAARGMGSRYHPHPPHRLYDSRVDTKRPAGSVLDLTMLHGGDNPHVRALVVNVTVVDPESAGFVTVWSGAADQPAVSTVNFTAGTITPNLAIVQTRPCDEDDFFCGPAGAPTFRLYTSTRAHVVVDTVGMFDDGTLLFGRRFQPMNPTRIVDSRIGQGLPAALGPDSTGRVTAPASMVGKDEDVLVLNATAVAPTNNTVLTVWPADYEGTVRPQASNVNPAAGQTVSAAVFAELGPYKRFNVHNNAGTTNVVMDVVGRFYWP